MHVREEMATKSDTPPKRIDRPVMDSVAIDANFTVDREKVSTN